MALQIYEFSRGFQETLKDGIWVSGGFGDKIDRYYKNQVPLEIREAVEKGLFEIPNAYRPNPGAEALINSGHPERIAQPELNSIAIITRELENYCVLAVATGQIDDKGRDLIVGYQYFWLNVRELEAQIQKDQEPDGIWTLLHWWLRNGQPCFDMNPDSRREYTFAPRPCLKTEVESPEKYPSPIREQLLKVESESPPSLFEASKDGVQLNFKQSLFQFHSLALKANQDYDECPLAWAWNVRGLSHLEVFSAIYCADAEAFERISLQKQRIPKKPRKPKSTPPLVSSQSSKSESVTLPDNSETIPENQDPSDKLPDVQSGTIVNPDPLLSQIEKQVLNVVQNPNSESQLRNLLSCYSNYPPSRDNCWENLLQKKVNEFKAFSEIRFLRDVRYICLLFILVSKQTSTYLTPDHVRSSPESISFLNELLGNIRRLRVSSPDKSNRTYDKIEQRISRLLTPNPPFPNPTEWISRHNLLYLILAISAVLAVLASIWPYIHSLVDLAFQDTQNHWAKPYIQALAEKKIIKDYRPEDFINRAEFATLVTKAFPDSKSKCTNFPFTDVKNDFWAYQAIKEAYCRGFLAGSGDSRFRPQQPMSRLEVLQTLVKGLGLTVKNNQAPSLSFYQDVAKIPPKARDAVVAATEAGLVVSYSHPCLLEPNRNATRAEVAAMVYQALVKVDKAPPLDFPVSSELNLESHICRIQQLEARSDEHRAEELTKARKNLIQWMESHLKQSIETLRVNPSKDAEEGKKSARETVKQKASYLKSLVAQKTLKDLKMRQLKLGENNQEVKNLKETLQAVGFYGGKIDTEFDIELEETVKSFQNQPNDDGIVGSQTWSALSQTFEDANFVIAYEHLLEGLKSDQNLTEIIKQLKACGSKGSFGYVSCVNSQSSNK